jgi:hypothetical protein
MGWPKNPGGGERQHRVVCGISRGRLINHSTDQDVSFSHHELSMTNNSKNPLALNLSKGLAEFKHVNYFAAVMVRSRPVGISFRTTELNIFPYGFINIWAS